MCFLCQGFDRRSEAARRLHLLELLALVEHPDALPRSAALRLSREMLNMIETPARRFECDAVTADEATGENP